MNVEIVLKDVDDLANRPVVPGVGIVSADVDFDGVTDIVRARGGLGDILHTQTRSPNLISLMLGWIEARDHDLSIYGGTMNQLFWIFFIIPSYAYWMFIKIPVLLFKCTIIFTSDSIFRTLKSTSSLKRWMPTRARSRCRSIALWDPTNRYV